MSAEWHPSNTEKINFPEPCLAPVPMADWAAYDFIDLGSNKGGSIVHGAKRWKARGIGIDANERRVGIMQAAGVECVYGDAAKLDADKAVRFVSMMNFLEHLPDFATVEDTVARAARAARDFLYIRHPSFEGEETAVRRGVRIHHWDWPHHSAHVRLADFDAMFRRLGFPAWLVRDIEPISHSSHPHVIATSLPMGLNPETSAFYPKPLVAIEPQWWRRHDIFVQLRPMKPKYWAKLVHPTKKESGLVGGDHTFAPMAVMNV